MSSIDNNLGGGGGSASASGKKGAIQLSDGNFNLTSNKELKSDPKTGTITTTGLTTTGTVFAATISTSNLIADTVTNLTVIGNASITGNAVIDGTISTTGNGYFSSNVGIGTTDTAEYKFLVKQGTSNLFGVPYNTSDLSNGKTIVYNGSSWVYDNAGPADGSQTGEILAWNNTSAEWSANSAVVVEGTSVGIGSTQPTQKLDVAGNIKATGSLTGASATVSGQVRGATISSTGNVVATGSLTGASATVTGQVRGATISSTGNVVATGSLTGASATVTGQVRGATISSTGNVNATGNVVATGSLTGASATVTGQVRGATISSTGNVNATGNLVATGYLTAASATVTGQVLGATISSTGNVNATGNVVATGSLTGASATVTGQVRGATISSTGNVNATGNVVATGSLTGASATVTGQVRGATISSTGNVNATGNLVATGYLTAASATVTGQVRGATISSTGNVNATGNLVATGSLTAASATVTGQVRGATISSTGNVNATGNLVATGSLTGASATVSGRVQGATVSSTGHVIATGSVTGTTVNTPTLVVSKDAQITGNLTVSGGLITITSTTTGTQQFSITNNGTGPALVVKQIGAQPIANFLDDSVSAFFISGGELTGKDGFVGLGTEAPQERLDVRGNIVSNVTIQGATISSTGNVVATGSLTGASATVTGQVRGATISSTGNVVATGSLTGASATVTGQVRGATISSTGNVVATGSLTGASATVTGQVRGATISSTGNVNATGNLVATGSLTGASATVTGQVLGATISSTGNVNATGNLVATGYLTASSATVTGQIQASGTITTSDKFVHGAGATGNSGFISESPGFTTDHFIYTRALINENETQSTPAAIVFGNNNVYGNDEISLVTVGQNRVYIDNTGTVSVPGTLSASNVETSNLTVTNLNTVTNNAFIGGTLSASTVQTSNVTLSTDITVSNAAAVGGFTRISPLDTANTNFALEIFDNTSTRTSRIRYNGDALFRTITVSNIQGGSPLTISAPGGTINVQSDMIMVGSTLTADKITGNSPLSLSAGGGDSIHMLSNVIAGTIYYTTLTTQAGVTANINAFDVTASNSLVSSGNAFITSNFGVGTTDPGTYRLLVDSSGTKQFGVPGNDTPTTGDTLIYNANGEWVYSFPAGNLPAGSINNEILTWNGSNWVPNSSIITTNSNTAIGIGTYTPSSNLHVIGSVTATSDVNISGVYQGGKLRVGTALNPVAANPNVAVPGNLTVSGTLTSDEWIHTSNLNIEGNVNVEHNVLVDGNYQGTGMRLDGTLQTLFGAIPDLSVAGSITATGDIKTDQTFRGTDASITGTITTSNITHGSKVTVSSDLLMGPGTTLTASNIVGASPVTISSDIVMATGFTLTAGAIQPPLGSESNLKITGTITTSNIVANTGDNLLISSSLEVGTSNLFVDTATGNVGIGTDSPDQKMHIKGGNLKIENIGSDNIDNKIILAETGYNDNFFIGTDLADAGAGDQSFKIGFSASGDSGVVNSNVLMTILGSGNVGIGTDSPTAKLHVNGTTQYDGVYANRFWVYAVGDNADTIGTDLGSPWYGMGYDRQANNIGNDYSSDIPILSGYNGVALRSGSGNIILTSGGNVGIGVTSPGQKLDVGGSINANSAVYVGEWLRMNSSGQTGIYWHNSQGTGYAWHIYPRNRNDMYFRTGTNNGGIAGTCGDATERGYVHWTTANEIGFLNNSRQWSLRCDTNKNCEIYGNLQVDGNLVTNNMHFVRCSYPYVNNTYTLPVAKRFTGIVSVKGAVDTYPSSVFSVACNNDAGGQGYAINTLSQMNWYHGGIYWVLQNVSGNLRLSLSNGGAWACEVSMVGSRIS